MERMYPCILYFSFLFWNYFFTCTIPTKNIHAGLFAASLKKVTYCDKKSTFASSLTYILKLIKMLSLLKKKIKINLHILQHDEIM